MGCVSELSIGAIVEWTSQSAGITKTKRGEVVAIVPSGQRPSKDPHRVHSCGLSRDHVSYVVRCNGRNYWPRVSQLRQVVP